MAFPNACAETLDLGNRRFQNTHSMCPIAFQNAGSYQRIDPKFVSGDANFPHVVEVARLKMYTAGDGLRRICPTGDPAVWFEIGAPYIKPAATWQKVTINAFTRTANRLFSVNTNVDVSIWFGGHFAKLEFELKGGYVPPNGQFAFPVGLNGLTRTGDTLYANGVPVMTLNKPVVYDAANKLDIRQITYVYAVVSGQAYILFTLPSLAGMARPVVDPTLTLQPDATAGKDATLHGSTNYGTLIQLFVGENKNESPGVYRSVIQFDLTSIPSSSTVTAATLSLWLYSSGTAYASNNRTLQAYRIRAGRDWVESQVTWDIYKTSNNWGTAGVANTTTDREATGIGSTAMVTTDSAASKHDWALTPGAGGVQDWVSGALANNGMVLIADTEVDDLYAFSGSDDTTAAIRPQLVVVYTTGGMVYSSSYDGLGNRFRGMVN